MSGATTTRTSIGIVGLGEVGTVVVTELVRGSRSVEGLDTRGAASAVAAAARLGIPLSTSPADFGSRLSGCIVAVDGGAALSVAREVVEHLAPGTLYADCTTKSPATRDAIAELCAAADVRFADVAIIDTVTWADRPVELLMSGPGARQLADVVAGTRLKSVVVDDRRPVATEVKLMRSVFTKGLEALLLEALTGAQALGIRPDVQRSITHFMREDFERIVDLLLGSALRHAQRRADEMTSVQELMIASLGAAPMTSATATVLRLLAEMAADGGNQEASKPAALTERVMEQRLFQRLGR